MTYGHRPRYFRATFLFCKNSTTSLAGFYSSQESHRSQFGKLWLKECILYLKHPWMLLVQHFLEKKELKFCGPSGLLIFESGQSLYKGCFALKCNKVLPYKKRIIGICKALWTLLRDSSLPKTEKIAQLTIHMEGYLSCMMMGRGSDPHCYHITSHYWMHKSWLKYYKC